LTSYPYTGDAENDPRLDDDLHIFDLIDSLFAEWQNNKLYKIHNPTKHPNPTLKKFTIFS